MVGGILFRKTVLLALAVLVASLIAALSLAGKARADAFGCFIAASTSIGYQNCNAYDRTPVVGPPVMRAQVVGQPPRQLSA
jgi:hypothetical protein